ncbi:HU family DNA-binding protein [Alkaliflexus imshenetskii]|uniref:HU family DNA-binding protein n=1 Tax=Alkaliflexus imshenetskii TaxID=286730 RepID=UPI00047E3504|nr:HU family DNA-binding protein [Alkaliflexus imshenetskii]
MTLKYKVVSTYQPGKGKDGDQLWFPKLTGSTRMGQNEIAREIQRRTTASRADVQLVLTALLDLMPELLLSGNTLHLDGFGTFRLHAKVLTESTARAVTSKNIKALRLSFIPDKGLKQNLQSAKFSLVKK